MSVETKHLSDAELDSLNRTFSDAPPQSVLEWALRRFGRSIALAWSGAEDVAVLHMIWRIDHGSRVFTLDTGRLNPETYDLIQQVRTRYGIEVEVLFPEAVSVERLVRERGVNLFYDSVENRKLCCRARKVEPLNRILRQLDGWITGLRRSQAITRGDLQKIEVDRDHGDILKVNPLADWSTEDVFRYLRENDVPTNALHAHGYPSIGCAPCTRAVRPGEDERDGRWWWESPELKECGLHVSARK